MLSRPGDPSYSRVDDKPLVDVLDGDFAKASAYHKELCQILTKAVVDPKDSMATDPARRCGVLLTLLSQVGLDTAALYCGLILDSHNYSRGVDSDGNEVCRRGKTG